MMEQAEHKSSTPEVDKTAGRWRPWLYWGLGSLLYLYAFFQRVAPSVMVNDLMLAFGIGAALVGHLSAFYFYAYGVVQIPVGVLVDKLGARRVLCAAALLCAVGSLFFAYASQIVLAYLGRLLIGLGSGVAFVSTLKIISQWFPVKRFAMLSGLTLMLGMLGGIGGQAPLAMLVDRLGWRETMVWASVFVFVLAVLLMLFVRDAKTTDVKGEEAHEDGVAPGLKAVIKNHQICIIAGVGFFQPAALFAFASLWGVPYMAVAYKLSNAEAAGMMSLILLGWAVGAPLQGWVSDHLHLRKIPLVLSAFTAAASLAGIIYMPGLPLPVVQVLLVVNGICSSALILVFALVQENAHAQSAGTAMGFANMAVILSAAVVQPVVGKILDINWQGAMSGGVRLYDVVDYQWALLPVMVMAFLAFVSSLFVRETHCRRFQP